MKKKLLFFTIVLFLMLILSGCTNNDQKPPINDNSTSEIIFYYGETCPHCKDVEKFISDNKISEKLDFQTKEVYNNKDNSNELIEKAAKCSIQKENIGVPFLWDGSKCHVGKDEIINFFNDKTNAN